MAKPPCLREMLFPRMILFLSIFADLIANGDSQSTATPCPGYYQCKTCEDATYGCSDCTPGYGQSTELYPSPMYVCRECGIQCVNCINRTCIECNSGYGPLDAVSCTACVDSNCLKCPQRILDCTQCKLGYGFSKSTGLCSPCAANCLTGCDNHGAGTCDQCINGYGLTETFTCQACSPHCSAGCFKTGAGNCDRCDAGFALSTSHTCEAITTTATTITTTTPTTTTTTQKTTTAAPSTTAPIAAATTAATVKASAAPSSGGPSILITSSPGNIINGKTGSSENAPNGQTDSPEKTASGQTGTSGNQVPGENGLTTASAGSGLIATSESNPTSGSGKDRFNSNTIILITLLFLIIGGVVISLIVFAIWCTRFARAAIPASQGLGILRQYKKAI